MARPTAGNANSNTPLHTLEFRVLLVLLSGNLHGYGIAKEIERTDTSLGRIFPTNLYRRLRDMAERGLIEQLPAADSGDPKRLFTITDLGRQVVRQEASRLENLVLEARQHDLLPSEPFSADR
jgi:DNA-binding PadR family transcriptional regulator